MCILVIILNPNIRIDVIIHTNMRVYILGYKYTYSSI